MKKLYLFLAAALVSMSSFALEHIDPDYNEPEGSFYSCYFFPSSGTAAVQVPQLFMPYMDEYTFTSRKGAGDWKMGDQTATNAETFSPKYAFGTYTAEGMPELTIAGGEPFVYGSGNTSSSARRVYVGDGAYHYITNAKHYAVKQTTVVTKMSSYLKLRTYFFNRPNQVMLVSKIIIPITTSGNGETVADLFPAEDSHMKVAVYQATCSRTGLDKYNKSIDYNKILIDTLTLTKANYVPSTNVYAGLLLAELPEPVAITGAFCVEITDYETMGDETRIIGDITTGTTSQCLKYKNVGDTQLTVYVATVNYEVAVYGMFPSIAKADEKQEIEIPAAGGTVEAYAIYSSKEITVEDITLPDWASVDTIAFEGDEYATSKKIYITLTADANKTRAERTGEMVINNQGAVLNIPIYQDSCFIINVDCATENGTISGAGKYIKGDTCTLIVTANYGYHFTQWNDGNTENPRVFVVLQDTSFTAQIDINQYQLTVQSLDSTKGTTTGSGYYDYKSRPTISAIPKEHYHFSQWNDGSPINPRQFTITQDTTFVAQFAPNNYQVMVTSADTNMGSGLGSGSFIYLSEQSISAKANYGYHFIQWNDGVTDNPRTIQVLSDTTFTAIFAKNIYTISTQAEHGSISGGGEYEYLSSVQLTATADEHYHFVRWNDGVTDNPRKITVEGDKTYTAIFSIDQHTISASAEHGRVIGMGIYDYGTEATLTVIPDFGYEFATWSDGNTDNPRTILVTEDATYNGTCTFATKGTCGNNLFWEYKEGKLIITGTGEMYDYAANEMPWYLYRDNIQYVVFSADLTYIGCNAFANFIRIEEITCFATQSPRVCSTSFDGLSKQYIYLYVPADYIRSYQVNPSWNGFDIRTKSADKKPIDGDNPIVTPSDQDVTITWPITDGTDTYTLTITKNGEVVCVLTFNANGQLTNIAFAAPGHNGAHQAPAAILTAQGYQFTVTGLNPGTAYNYSVTATDAGGQTLAEHKGNFSTTGGGTPTSVDEVHGSQPTMHKYFHNGNLIIERNGIKYTATGQKVR